MVEGEHAPFSSLSFPLWNQAAVLGGREAVNPTRTELKG